VLKFIPESKNMLTISHNPLVLTIAGFDPSSCAGILADIKTFEAHGVYGMAVCTANTWQTTSKFDKANWIQQDEIMGQLNLLLKENSFEYVKIGLIENLGVLSAVVDALFNNNNTVKIIWDPVGKPSSASTSGKPIEFYSGVDRELLEAICARLYLITPNLDEIQLLVPEGETEEAGRYLSRFCNVLIKGGHSDDGTSTDLLFVKSEVVRFETEKLKDLDKRGTGCVLSSAILSNLAKGKDLEKACLNAKNYIHTYLTSNRSKIGLHSYANQ
jgi:hydroxymethylpyrimidine/phosphomethylpyrimidine kinase